jgi:hypothetical protein
VVFGKGNRERVGLDLARKLDFDRDLFHRAAMLSEQRGTARAVV